MFNERSVVFPGNSESFIVGRVSVLCDFDDFMVSGVELLSVVAISPVSDGYYVLEVQSVLSCDFSVDSLESFDQERFSVDVPGDYLFMADSESAPSNLYIFLISFFHPQKFLFESG